MANIIVAVVLVVAVGAAARYIIKSKRSGKKCIGCPDSSTCGSGCCACCDTEKK